MEIVPVSTDSVNKAIEECDALGRDRFLEKYGFGRSTIYELVLDEATYDPKAIYAVAYGFDHAAEKIPSSNDLTSSPLLRRRLTDSGFEVRLKRGDSEHDIAAAMQQFLAGYDPKSMGPISSHHSMAELWRNVIEPWFATSGPVARYAGMRVKASYGQGNWAAAPWIAFLDPRETGTTTKGTYAVLLVKEDCTGFYLTAAQGVTEYKRVGVSERARRLKEVAHRVRSWGTSDIERAGFSLEPSPYIGDGPLARGYSASVIAHKYFPADAPLDVDDLLESLDAVLRFVDRDITGRESGGALEIHSDALFEHVIDAPTPIPMPDLVQGFEEAVRQSGMIMSDEELSRPAALVTALLTKPFVVLAGMSGSGKTQLALRLGEWLGLDRNGTPRSLVVPVRPDWTGPESLFGYEDALRPTKSGLAAWFVPPTLEFLLRAAREPDMPYLLVLDEMNLAHVERYFSDYLSGIESGEPVVPNLRRQNDGEWRAAADEQACLPLPKNVMVVGTVNVDETTYQFSPKVIDRSTTFEVRTATKELTVDIRKPRPITPASEKVLTAFVGHMRDDSWHSEGKYRGNLAEKLKKVHADLTSSGHEFGHRVFYECLAWGAALEAGAGLGQTAIFDELVLHKILPRVQGTRRSVEPVLTRLQTLADPAAAGGGGNSAGEAVQALPKSAHKINRMLASAQEQHFVSYLE